MTYTIPYHCTNCDHGFDKMFDYGTPAPVVVTCPNCGCWTGEKQRGHKPTWVTTWTQGWRDEWREHWPDDWKPEPMPEVDNDWPYRGSVGCYS